MESHAPCDENHNTGSGEAIFADRFNDKSGRALTGPKHRYEAYTFLVVPIMKRPVSPGHYIQFGVENPNVQSTTAKSFTQTWKYRTATCSPNDIF